MYYTPITPRVSETDGVGHVNNTVIPVWFEAGRREFFTLLSPEESFAGWRNIVINMNVDFLHEISYFHEVHVHTWVEKVGTTSIRLYEEMWQQGKLCARGNTTYVNVNPVTKSAEPVPESVRAQLADHLYSDAAARQAVRSGQAVRG